MIKLLSLAFVLLTLVWPVQAANTVPPSPATAGETGRAGIHPWLATGERISADLLLDGKETAKLDYRATSAGLKRQPALMFAIPAKTRRLELRGKLIDPQGKSRTFRKSWTIRDIAANTAPLYDHTRPWLERIREFAKRVDSVTLSPPKTAIATAEASLGQLADRLRVKLPEPLFALARYRIEIGDSYFLAPADMKTVTEMLLKDWDYHPGGKDGLKQRLPPAVRARYDRSIVVFIEVGDGYGALAWDPAGISTGDPGQPRGDRAGAQPGTAETGVWFWLHQDTLDEVTLLLDRDYRPKSAEDALTSAFQRFALGEFDSPATDNELIIDTANPHNLLQLHFEYGQHVKPVLWLRSYDYHYSLY